MVMKKATKGNLVAFEMNLKKLPYNPCQDLKL